jgi:hypothetical protein
VRVVGVFVLSAQQAVSVEQLSQHILCVVGELGVQLVHQSARSVQQDISVFKVPRLKPHVQEGPTVKRAPLSAQSVQQGIIASLKRQCLIFVLLEHIV